MPLLNKLASGKIFVDDFADSVLDPVWQVSPTDPTRYNANDEVPGYLRLKHGDTPLYLLMDMPNRDFIFEIANNYAPVIEKDTAGIVAFRDAVHRVELLEYFDPAIGQVIFTHMRMARSGNLYTGYGSRDGGLTWELIGSSAAEGMSKLGLVVNHGVQSGSRVFDVDYVKVFGDTKILVGNMAPGMKVELYNDSDVIKQSTTVASDKDHAVLDMRTLPIPFTGRIKIYDTQNTLLETTEVTEFWGGDAYWYGLMLEVYMDNDRLDMDIPTPLGYMTNGLIEKKVYVKNPGTDPVHGVTVSKHPYFSYRGAEWVQLAEDSGNAPGVYSNNVYLGTIDPGDIKYVWIKVTKVMADALANIGDRKFLLQVTN